MREPRRLPVAWCPNAARFLLNLTSAKRRKIKPSTGCEHWAEVSPELARSWSAAGPEPFFKRFLSVVPFGSRNPLHR